MIDDISGNNKPFLTCANTFIAMVFLCASTFATAQFNYSLYHGNFNQLPDFTTLTPVQTGISESIDLSVSDQADLFALVFTKNISIDRDTSFNFILASDDGSKLYIDDQVVINNDGLHATEEIRATVNLTAGNHTLRIEYFENTGGEVLEFQYAVVGGFYAPIPNDGQLNTTIPNVSEYGHWGPLIPWPHVAISAATLSDGRVLTWSSTEVDEFPADREFTHAAVFNPETNLFVTSDNNFHDMFCAGISTLENGVIVASGGNPDDNRTSAFDPLSLSWFGLADMNDRRWYGANITMPDNQIFSSYARAANARTELYNPMTNQWTRTPNAFMQTLVNEQNASNALGNDLQWWAQIAVTPLGKVFQGGPTQTYHVFDPLGGAEPVVLGKPAGERTRGYGNAVTYDIGKVLLIGGSDRSIEPQTINETVYQVDLTGPSPVIQQAAPMHFARALNNSVTLPNGEILVIGGNNTGLVFSDVGAVYASEIYHPQTNTWRIAAPIHTARTYHSTALLLKDGRVLSAGGGGCGGCSINHLDGQIYSPPYLFNPDGSNAIRPTLTNVTNQIGVGMSMTVNASEDTQRFTMVRLSGTTHHLNTDQRFVPVQSENLGNGQYRLTMNANPNVLILGNYWLFAVNANGTPSIGQTVQVLKDLNALADSDSDGIIDVNDLFPNDPLEIIDSDGDGVGDNGDAFPNDPNETLDSDRDGIGNNVDITPFGDETNIHRARFVRLEVLSEINNNPWASAAEIKLIGANDQPLARSNWIVSASSQEINGENAPATNAIDGDNSTIWHSEWQLNPATPPHQFIIDMGTQQNIKGLIYEPRTDGQNGIINAYQVYLSNDGVNWRLPIITGNIGNLNPSTIIFPIYQVDSDGDGVPNINDAFPNDPNETKDTDGDGIGDNSDSTPLGSGSNLYTTRFVRLTALSEINNNDWASAAEINLIGANDQPLDRSNWVVAASSEELNGENAPASNAIDGDPYTIWHTEWQNTSPKHPHEFMIDMGSQTTFKTLSYLSRSGNPNGTIKRYQLEISNDGNNWTTIVANGEFLNPTIDTDGDGVANSIDAFPNDPTESRDSDNDGIGDNTDAFPNNPNESKDSDGDGIGDNSDPTPLGSGSNIYTTRYIRLTALSEINNNPWASAAEIYLIGADDQPLNRSNWVVSVSSEEMIGENAPATNAIDGDIYTIWHTEWSTKNPNHPHHFMIDMGSENQIKALRYVPRTGGLNGTISDYQIHISPDGANWGAPIITGKITGARPVTINFPNQNTTGSNITTIPVKPRNSTTLIIETSSGIDRIWNVNPDNNSVSVSNNNGQLIQEINVGKQPWALTKRPNAAQIFVTNKEDATISIINTDTRSVEQTLALPYASQPHGIVFNSTGTEYFVVLEAVAMVEKYDAVTNQVMNRTLLSGTPRHIAITFDDSRLFISNFITPPIPGESTAIVNVANGFAQIFSINPTNMAQIKTINLSHDYRNLNGFQGPGLPNYLNAPVISFDNRFAYIPSKKDNIDSGQLRGKVGMTFESTVRANGSRITLSNEQEDTTMRIDFDNASVATGAALTGDNRYLLVALETSQELAVYDTINNVEFMRLPTGRAPQGVALSTDGSIAYVHNFMDRSVSRFDLSEMINTRLPATNLLNPINVVTNETLSPQVLRGKQLFYDAKDTRLARDRYMSCASCHNDGGHDGRVWDFTSLGEGLRNTTALKGRAAMGHGFLHWSANFDELQDFERQIRTLAGGTGLMSDADFNTGTRNQPLGDQKAGLSADLDALSAYVSSLNTFAKSPYRQQNGQLSTKAIAGKTTFNSQCSSCHGGNNFTNSLNATTLRNIGTINASSGLRLGNPLTGIDTPTLRDVWSTAPYLHNGSAKTISEAVTAHNNLTLTATELENVISYVLEIGSEEVGQ
jgi:cytochrome c